MSGGPGNIMIRVGADTADAIKDLGRVDKSLGDTRSRAQKAGDGMRRAALPAAAALAGLAVAAKGAAQAAAEDAAGQEKLRGALERTAGATDAQVKAAEDYISSLSRATGVADDELRPALAKLASATGSVEKGQKDLKLALDISAQSGKSVEAVSKALAGAYDGKTAALAKLVPGLDQATLKSKDMAKITGELAEKVGGAATEAANTATGRYKVMQNQMGELQESIGAALIPVVERLSAVMLKATDFAAEHTTALKVVIGVVAALAAGVLVVNAAIATFTAVQTAVRAATVAWSAAQTALNIVLTANPIGLVVIAIAGLAAGIVLAYKHSDTFREAVQNVWAVLRNLNPLEAAEKAYDALRGAVSGAVKWVGDFVDRVAAAFGRVDSLHDALTVLWKVFGYTNPIGVLIQHFDGLRDAIASVVGWIGRIHFPSPPSWFGKIGGLFGGGSSNGGDFGAVARATARAPFGAAPAGGGTAPRSLGGGSLTINIHGALDPEGTARAVQRVLAGHARRQGFAT